MRAARIGGRFAAVLNAATLIASAAACSANDDVPAPSVGSVIPDHAAAGALVTVNGMYFCQVPEDGSDDDPDPMCTSTGEVHFGAAPGTPTNWSDTSIQVEVPDGLSGAVDLSVIAGGRESNSITFTAE
ncbi:MAG TPA: IPT/TIG domain-containing protein [Kofleriaceae bacterium]|jgi:hypothetical protein